MPTAPPRRGRWYSARIPMNSSNRTCRSAIRTRRFSSASLTAPTRTPPITPDGYYITGDVFRRDKNGFHYFVGRTDDMFVSGGENIFPSDVERMVETHPDVGQAVVIPVDDDIKGTKPVAFVIPRG